MTERSTAIVLFTDLVGSTELRSRVGEDAADSLRQQHDALVTGATEASRGTVVKNLGDGIMATFAGASDAVAAAVATRGPDRNQRR
jgi:class 3 adenylate cyclase